MSSLPAGSALTEQPLRAAQHQLSWAHALGQRPPDGLIPPSCPITFKTMRTQATSAWDGCEERATRATQGAGPETFSAPGAAPCLWLEGGCPLSTPSPPARAVGMQWGRALRPLLECGDCCAPEDKRLSLSEPRLCGGDGDHGRVSTTPAALVLTSPAHLGRCLPRPTPRPGGPRLAWTPSSPCCPWHGAPVPVQATPKWETIRTPQEPRSQRQPWGVGPELGCSAPQVWGSALRAGARGSLEGGRVPRKTLLPGLRAPLQNSPGTLSIRAWRSGGWPELDGHISQGAPHPEGPPQHAHPVQPGPQSLGLPPTPAAVSTQGAHCLRSPFP